MLCGTRRHDDGKVLFTDNRTSEVWAKYNGWSCYSCDRVIYDYLCKVTYVVPDRPTCCLCYVLCDEQDLNNYISWIESAKPQKYQ